MASNIWQVGQKYTAEEIYNSKKEQRCFGLSDEEKEAYALKEISLACVNMIFGYSEILKDQNDYLIEIDDMNEDINNINNEYKERIKILEKEIKELKQKEADGTITEDEKNKLFNMFNEIDVLTGDCKETLTSKKDKLKKEKPLQIRNFKDKENVATDYGKTAIEKGDPRAEEDWEVGKAAVKVGNKLLDIVNTARNNESKIQTMFKK